MGHQRDQDLKVISSEHRESEFVALFGFIDSELLLKGIKVTSKRERPFLFNRHKELIFPYNALLFVYRLLQTSLTTANDVREVS